MPATLREQRRQAKFQTRLNNQMERERNGEPVHPEIAARLTKPKVREQLYQVLADVNGEKLPLRVGPMIAMEACEQILVAVNGQIALGKLPGWGNTRIEPVIFQMN